MGLLAALAGCATYGVEEFSSLEQSKLVARNSTNSDHISHMTWRYVISEGLEEKCTEQPIICILDIDTQIRATGDLLLAVYAAELAFQTAKDYDLDDPTFARLNASALVYASGFLFQENGEILDYHPSHRMAIDLYNRSLAQLLRYFHASRTLTASSPTIPLMRGSLQLRLENELHYLPGSFLHIRVAYDFRVKGFKNHQSYYGMGTPLVLIRPYPKDPLNRQLEASRTAHMDYSFLGKADQAYPASVVFDHDGSYFRSDRSQYQARLRFVDSLSSNRVKISGQEVPLEIDLSSPMAYMLSGAEKEDSMLRRLDGDSIGETSGLYMLSPYDENKIPLVFIHGLISSPMTWFPMINELMGDPQIRENYQFWVYWYPTSNPVEFSADGLRIKLKEARERFGFERMVLVGHSMGGLLARLMIQTSRSQDWIQESGIPAERFRALDEDSLSLLRRVTEYDPLPFVDRAIFLASPHRGSAMADGFLGYLGRSLMSLPTGVAGILETGLDAITGEEEEAKLAPPGGIESLSPDSLFVRVTMKQPFARDVPYHSIIGSRSAVDLDWITDTVVPYASAHLPGAQSELLVESDHSVHATMEAILEVRRILRLNLEESPKVSAAQRLRRNVIRRKVNPQEAGAP